MDIAALSSAMTQASIGDQVGISVAKLAMENANQDAQNMTKMMELSVNPNVGKNFDASV